MILPYKNKISKLLHNDDKITILFNFLAPPDKPKLTIEENIQTAEQISSALNNTQSSRIQPLSAPQKPYI